MMPRLIAVILVIGLVQTEVAAESESPASPQTLFKNVNVFDGMSPNLEKGVNVLVEGRLIKAIGKGVGATNPEAVVIDGGGRSLIPGLIESHVHLNFQHMVGGYDTLEFRDCRRSGPWVRLQRIAC